MHQSRTIGVTIARSLAATYAFAAEPRNIPAWTAIPPEHFRHRDGTTYEIEQSGNVAHTSFTAPNDFGILDYNTTTPEGVPVRQVYARLVSNGAGSELLFTLLRRDGSGYDAFDSEAEWINSDLLVLKSLLDSPDVPPGAPSRTIAVDIERPWQSVFSFLLDPNEFPRWASNLGPNFDFLGGNLWATDTADGRLLLRFPVRNPFGVLDHSVTREGDEPVTIPMRVVPNGAGATILYTLFQYPGVSDEAIVSEGEWVRSDLMTLKSLLEAV